MTEQETLVQIQEVLQHLEHVSFVAHRDTKEAMPSVEPQGAADTLLWIETARDLFFRDREGGKSFLRHTPHMVEQTGSVRAWVEQAAAFGKWVNGWRALEGFLTQAGDVWQAWGAEGERAWYDMGIRWCERGIPEGRAYFGADFRELAGGEGIEGLRRLMQPAETLYLERKLNLDVFLAGATIARALVGSRGLEAWARRGADILQTGRSRGEAYFKLESEESLKHLLDTLPGYRPRAHSRFLRLIQVAWFGAHVSLEDGNWRPGRGRPMVETDGVRLFLPAVLESRDEAVVAVLHAAGHLHFDTYCGEDIEALFREMGMAHPPLDEDQRITWRPLFAAYAERMFRFQLLFDLCEDLRVNHRLQGRVPGFLSRLLRLARNHPAPEGAAGEYYRVALGAHESLITGQGLDARLQPLLSEGATIQDSFRIARALFEDAAFPEIDVEGREQAYLPGLSMNTARAVYPRKRGEPVGGYNEDTDAHADQKAVQEKQAELPPPQAPEQRQNDPDPDINVPQENTSGSGGRIGVGIPMPAQVDKRGVAHRQTLEGVPYPEWDYREQRYLSDWARVHEKRLEESDPDRAELLLAEHAPMLKRLRRALELQRPSRVAPLRKQLDGDELDLEAVTGFIADKKAGLSPKPFIYRRRTVQHRDTAVLLLADMSTSIMAKHPSGQGKVVDRLRAGLMMFAEAIESVGDPYAICGFASRHHDNVNFYVLKDFHEHTGPEVRASIAAVSGRLASRMGAAIRHGIRRFEQADAHHRLLLILSDGRPADYDDGGDSRYLHEDTRMAMKEAVDAGVHPFCITLDTSGSEYLPAIFGPGHYLVLDNVDDLPRRLPEIYLRLRR
ncbi:von Willebrand factor type A [Thioalkalivibrio sulfidiphilus HL-EbGr7]|uniref:von Willebrand factor type A n=1 Tax=Thioalkalivibrio sulfidiphilus (strain HL-EbGR7) TaxID=396588 RepID=B8GUC3_THISH|nr:VWA domain-containing protein [Thioalkalivibrio sulfidiphilus]ACL73243.1 von Willebrand factor type A [Thioalkalivibrio sulfidiphilus HL-EbGr7]